MFLHFYAMIEVKERVESSGDEVKMQIDNNKDRQKQKRRQKQTDRENKLILLYLLPTPYLPSTTVLRVGVQRPCFSLYLGFSFFSLHVHFSLFL